MIDPNRVTERVNLSLILLELKRALRPVLIILVGVAAAAVAGNYILTNINGGIGSTHTVKMEFTNVTGVVPARAEVRFYGIEAGLITNADLEHGHAVLTMTVADKFGKVYRNATAELRPNTALQDMYVDIVSRGTPGAGVAGPNYVVPDSQTSSPVNLADVLNTFQPDVRTQMYNLLDQLGNGLADRGQDLRQAFVQLAPFVQSAGTITRQLAVRADLTKQLVHNAGTLSAILASRSTQLRTLVTNGDSTLAALSTEGGSALRQTIAELPGTLDTATDTLNELNGAYPNLSDVVNKLNPVANQLPAALHSIQSFATAADPAVTKLEAPVRTLQPVASQLQPFTSNLSTALNEIQPQVADVDQVAKNWNECIPFVNEFWMWDDSMSKYTGYYGPQVRGNAHVGFYSLPDQQQQNYVTDYTCAGGPILDDQPSPKYPGPAPAP